MRSLSLNFPPVAAGVLMVLGTVTPFGAYLKPDPVVLEALGDFSGLIGQHVAQTVLVTRVPGMLLALLGGVTAWLAVKGRKGWRFVLLAGALLSVVLLINLLYRLWELHLYTENLRVELGVHPGGMGMVIPGMGAVCLLTSLVFAVLAVLAVWHLRKTAGRSAGEFEC